MTVRPVPVWLCGVTGFAGSVSILAGVALAGSPFSVHAPGAWFLGAGRPSGSSGFPAVMLVYAGIVVLLAAWFELVRAVRRQPWVPVSRLAVILAAWVVPVLVMPPAFSRDIYSYVAQGELVDRGLSPYLRTPSALGAGRFLDLVDPLWRHAPAAYGPAWERLAGAIVALSGHQTAAAAFGFRLAALAGLALIAWAVPSLARSAGRPGNAAFALAALNPAVLLTLVGAAHNDALMLGLLVAGCALARRGHVLPGLVLCALAAQVKIPALIGAVFIGWWWSEDEAAWRQRIPRVAGAVAIVAALLTVIGLAAHLGWDWLTGLANPGTVVSWLDPATAVGLAAGHAAAAAGLGQHAAILVAICRAAGLALAAVLTLRLLLRSGRDGPAGEVAALGWSLLLVALLGPVVWPWYETWGFVVLAAVAEGWALRLILALSAAACFADVPAARSLAAPSQWITLIGWIVLAVAVAGYGLLRLLPSARLAAPPGRRVAAGPAGGPGC
ncbi:MAG: polyprenol phosphomannose-dependent alpha 1,6 mannosyltransferase MptB [Streptosporangiaceae bacterium]